MRTRGRDLVERLIVPSHIWTQYVDKIPNPGRLSLGLCTQ